MFLHDIRVFVVFITCYSAGRTIENERFLNHRLVNGTEGRGLRMVMIGGRLEIQSRLIVLREHNGQCKHFFFLRRFMQGC